MSVLRRRLRVVSATILFALALCWLLESTASPLHGYLLGHPTLRNLWMVINTAAALLGFAFSQTVHRPSLTGYLLGLALQWGLLGALVSLWVIPPSRVGDQRGQER